jgi:hypothetical protein
MSNESDNCAQVSKFLIGEKKAIRDIGLVRDNGKTLLAVTVWIPTGSQPPYKAVASACEVNEAAIAGVIAALQWKGTPDGRPNKESHEGQSGPVVGADSGHAANGSVGGTDAKGNKVS